MNKIIIKIWMGIASVIISMILLLWGFQVIFLEQAYTMYKAYSLERELKYIEEIYQEVDNEDMLQEQLGERARVYNYTLYILDKQMNIMPSSNVRYKREYRLLDKFKSQIQVYIDNDQKISENYSFKKYGDTEYLVLGEGFEGREGYRYALILFPVHSIQEVIEVLKWQLIIVSIIAGVLIVTIGSVLARKISKPIATINQATRKIAQGDLEVYVDIKSNDEIEELGSSINHMTKSLREAAKLQREFIANVSHEFKTPISCIQLYKELLEEEINDSGKQYLRIIEENIRKLNMMVTQVMEISKLESGYLKVNLCRRDLTKCIERILGEMDDLAQAKSIDFKLTQNKEKIGADIDEDKLTVIIMNLLTNSIKYSNGSGTIGVCMLDKDKFVQIEIQDSGLGIKKEDIPHIWERFYKIDKSKESTGLGLSIVKSLFEVLGYSYGVESEVGVGTTIWFRIPKNHDESNR